jgi:hypothetical protein
MPNTVPYRRVDVKHLAGSIAHVDVDTDARPH